MKTAERTIERPRVERVVETPARRRSATTLIAVVVALAVGLLGGYLLRGSDDVEPAAAVSVDGSELTDRQEQMVDMIDDYTVAWQTGDGEAAEAMFVDSGTLEFAGTVRRADDGGIARYVDTPSFATLDVLEPMLVSGGTVLCFHTFQGTGDLADVIEFTTTGELLIISHEIIS